MKSKWSKVALCLLTVSLTACGEAVAPTTAPVMPDGGAAGEDAPAVQPTPGASAQAPASASPSAAPAAPVEKTTLRGKVYDESGAPVRGAKVHVRSLDAQVPFEAEAELFDGSYVMNDAPVGTLVEISVRKDGWTKRSRVESLLPMAPRLPSNLINFGGPNNPYFLSRYPEIESVEPTEDAVVGSDKLLLKLTLSEPLDSTNRRRLENALRVIPANAEANGGAAGTTDLSTLEDRNYPLTRALDGGSAPYSIRRNASFLEEATRTARVTWDAEGKVATFEFDAPLRTSRDGKAKYQLALAAGAEAIVDRDGNRLGTAENGSLGSQAATGNMILGAFKAKNFGSGNIAGLTTGSREHGWALTHDNVATFQVREDKTAPTLTAVSVGQVATDTRIRLTFDEPLAAYDGTLAGASSAALQTLANYSFVVGRRVGALDGVKLDGEDGVGANEADSLNNATYVEREKEFRFPAAAYAASRAAAVDGSVLVQVDPKDPRQLLLTIVNRPNFFGSDAFEIKARAVGVADPAGNAITSVLANRNVVTGKI